MGYTRKWTPPTIPLRDDLPAWKILFNDIHDNLILAGLEQTDTPDQLDIDGVSALPADGTYAGFREYAFTDAAQVTDPIIIKLEFGCGSESLGSSPSYHRSRTPRVRTTVFLKSNLVVDFDCPQRYSLSGTLTTQLTSTGSSVLCYFSELGFLGIAYGIGSRNRPFSANNGGYYGASLAFFIQRVESGVIVYANGLDVQINSSNLWTGGIVPLAKSTFSNGTISSTRTDMAPRVGRQGFAGNIDQVILEPIYAPSNPPTMFPHIFSYWHELIMDGQEFDFTVNGVTRNYIAIGRETGISVDSFDGQRAGIAMLFE